MININLLCDEYSSNLFIIIVKSSAFLKRTQISIYLIYFTDTQNFESKECAQYSF